MSTLDDFNLLVARANTCAEACKIYRSGIRCIEIKRLPPSQQKAIERATRLINSAAAVLDQAAKSLNHV